MPERSYSEYLSFLQDAFLRVRAAMAEHGGRDATLLAATKIVPVEVINYAVDTMGLTDIGENRVQELLEKYDALHKNRVNLHFIGRLQPNKVKYIIDKVCLIHSVDSEKLAAEIDRQSEKHGLIMKILMEVNAGKEASKGGVAPEEAAAFAEKLTAYPHLALCGMMVVSPAGLARVETMKYFREMYRIFIDIFQKKMHNKEKCFLSMGMSDSYPEALDCGANLIRLGSALFGKRDYPVPPVDSADRCDAEDGATTE